MSHLFWLSFRFLKGERKGFSPVLVVSLVGIAFGMVAMVTTLSVMNGFQKAYEDSILNFNAHIVLTAEGDIDDPASVVTELEPFRVREEGKIVGVTPFAFREGLSLGPAGATSIVIKGIDPREAEKVYPETFIPIDPNLPTWEEALSREGREGRPVVVAGNTLLKDLASTQGGSVSTIRLLVPREPRRGPLRGGEKGLPLEEMAGDFQVVGSFASGLHEFDSQFIVMALASLQKEFGLGRNVSGFEILLDDRNKAEEIARELEQKLTGSFQAIAWGELNEALFSAMKIEKAMFFLIMFVILLVATFNVVGVLAMQVHHRTHELNILSALGMTKGRLGHLFGLQGLLLATGGIFLGTLLAALLLFLIEQFFPVAIDPKIYFISELPVSWPWSLWIALIAGALLLSSLVSWLSSHFLLRRYSLIHTFR